MTVIVNSGSTLAIPPNIGLTLTTDSTIAVNAVLAGAGAITGAFNLVNDGTIGGVANPREIDIGSSGFTNSGVIDAAGQSVAIDGSVLVSNFSAGTLTQGTWEVSGNGNLNFGPGVITTDDATIILGSLASVQDSNTFIQNSLTEVGSAGFLGLNGLNWVAPGSFVIDGTMALAGSAALGTKPTLSALGGITVSASGSLLVGGSINSPLVLNGFAEIENGVVGAGPGDILSTVSGTGTLQVDPSEFLTLAGTSISVATLSNFGTVVFDAVGGTATFATILASNSFMIAGATVTVPSWPGNSVTFKGGELVVGEIPGFVPTMNSFGNEDTLVLDNLVANSASLTLGASNNAGMLTISDGGPPLATFDLLAPPNSGVHLGWNYGNAVFTASPGPDHNTTITVSDVLEPICFRSGTRIARVDGEVPVEELAVGDRVLSYFARERRVVWIGCRRIDCRRHRDPTEMFPVRITAHAFGDGLPRRDLFLSPGHAVFVDGVLIPVKWLINDRTVVQVPDDIVTFFHVELDEHDLVYSEGLATESYLDTGNRRSFANGGPSKALFPDFGAATWESEACAPLVLTGAKVARARRLLEERAAGVAASVSLAPASVA